MDFCANCGRQRDGSARFCADCGTAFDAPASPPEAEGVTRTDVPADVTRTDPSDAFASWYQSPEPAGRPGDDGTWPPTQTVQATPVQRYQGGAYPGGAYPGGPPGGGPLPGGPPPSSRAPRDRRGLFAALIVIVVLAAGGGAYALATSLGKHHTATPPAQPGTGSSPAPASPPASAPASPPATPSATLSLVALGSGVSANPAAPQVETVLSHYFHGINSRDYAEYASTLTAAEKAKQTQSAFESGYSTTTDSGMTLTTLSSGSGGLTATVTFTSHQAAAQSVDHSPCNDWTLNFYLAAHGSGYLIGPEPSGYQPDHSDC